MYANVVLGTHYFDIETIRRASCYLVVDTYIRLKAQQFQHNAFFQEDGAPHTRLTIRSLLNEMFPDSRIGRHALASWPAGSLDLALLDVFHRAFRRHQVDWTLVSLLYFFCTAD